jgi:hypothetical protein
MDIPRDEETPMSLESRKRKLEIERKEKEFERETYWKSCCCGSTDRRILNYATQVGFGLLISTFCIFKLSSDIACAEENVYISLLSGIIGVFLPSPSLGKH